MAALARHAGLRVFRLFSRRLAQAAPADARLRLLGAAEVLALCGDAELDLASDKVGAAFARGDLCAAAFDADRLAGYAWYAFAPLPHLDGAWVEFAADAAWIYKSYVRPQYRGRGIAGHLYRFGDRAGLERGRQVSLICVESHNRPSVGAALASGYAGAGWAGYLRGPRLRAWSSPRAAGHGVRFFDPA